jgi:MFS family permease
VSAVADRAGRQDRVAVAVTTMFMSFCLGGSSVALPLIALRAGYDGTQIGILVACSALAAMGVRPLLARVMRIVPDRVLVAASAGLLALSSGFALASLAMVPFVVAHVLQGASRSCFWTGIQTHVVRGPGPSARALARVNLVSSLGLLAGPAAAGWLLERGPAPTLVLVGAVAVAAVPASLRMGRFDPFVLPPDRPPGRIWRRPGVDAACWAGATAGGWRALVGSYVVVAFERVGQASSTIGVLVAVANAASVAGAVLVSRLHPRWLTAAFASGTLVTGVGLALCVLVAGSAPLAAAALALSGLGAGALQTVGPVLGTDAVHPEERGEAIAAAGMFRAGVGLGAPVLVAALLGLMPLTAAMSLAGVTLAAPTLLVRRLARTRPLGGGEGSVA